MVRLPGPGATIRILIAAVVADICFADRQYVYKAALGAVQRLCRAERPPWIMATIRAKFSYGRLSSFGCRDYSISSPAHKGITTLPRCAVLACGLRTAFLLGKAHRFRYDYETKSETTE